MRVASQGPAVSLAGIRPGKPLPRDGFTLLRVPGSSSSRVLKLLLASSTVTELDTYAKRSPAAMSLAPFTHGGPASWPEILKTRSIIGADDGPLAVDVLTLPDNNPWHLPDETSGLDFFADGRSAAVCTWDGDVWLSAALAGRRPASPGNASRLGFFSRWA